MHHNLSCLNTVVRIQCCISQSIIALLFAPQNLLQVFKYAYCCNSQVVDFGGIMF